MMRRLCLVLVFCTALAGAASAEPPAGTKNFTPPSVVPNYFSNEAGAPLGSGGIVHPHMPRAAVAEEPEERPYQVVPTTQHRPVRHVASAKRKRHETRVASARGKRRAGKHAEGKSHKTKTAAAKARAARRAAEKKQAIKAAAQGRSAPAKPKQAGHHAG